MLNKESRLKSKDFQKLKKGVYKNTPLFNAKIYGANLLDNINKLAIIIPKKNIKKANKRNALKRKVCYAYRKLKKGKVDSRTEDSNKKIIILNYIGKNNPGLNTKSILPAYKEIENNIKIILNN